MKLAVTGKGGVGKTTLSSLLARLYAREGRKVIAIDANPDANLGVALGFPQEVVKKIVPISEMADLVEERTGVKPGTSGGFFRLNPRVEDIPERFAATQDSLRLLVLGTVKKGGGGCFCPESALLRSLMRHLLVDRSEVVIMDMDAGMEHLGRGTAASVDAFIVVVEPGRRSLETARAIRGLARDLGIEQCYLVGNKVSNEEHRQLIREGVPDFSLLGFISYHPQVANADFLGKSAFDLAPEAVAEVREIKARLEGAYRARGSG